jgi:ribonuclease HI
MELSFDGACEPNPGTGAIGFVLTHNGVVLERGSAVLPRKQTNNTSEYAALLLGIKAAVRHLPTSRRLKIHGDSQLVVKQCTHEGKRWKCNKPELVRLRDAVLDELDQFDWSIHWVRREGNSAADELSKAALTNRGIVPRY